MNVHNPQEMIHDWQTAQQYLKDGNQRYLDNNTVIGDTSAEDRAALKNGQHPFAVIVTCSDSRVAPEIYFDQNLGDIFVIRNAGNIVDMTVLGSIEYAVEHLEVPLIVVVGHSCCGAVTAALGGGGHQHPHNLQSILDKISHSIEGSVDIDEAIYANINSSIEEIEENPIVKENGAKVLGAYYDIASGKVSWL